MKMQLRNNEIMFVIEFLMELKLKGQDSRLRTRLVRQLQEHYNSLVMAERQQLIEEYGVKDENGELKEFPVTLEDGSEGLEYKIDDIESFNKEMDNLFAEHYTIVADENTEKMLTVVKKAVFNYDEELSGVEALQYDRVCEIFEAE